MRLSFQYRYVLAGFPRRFIIVCMGNSIRWGIVGTGKIARKMAQAVAAAGGGELWGVGSRSLVGAQTFIKDFGGKRAYGSYSELYGDPEIDIVYIATPHPYHASNALEALDAGKPVLCEKPFAMDSLEAREVIARARSRKLFLMEAMWTRFLPAIREVKSRINRGEIGALRMISADFGYRSEYDPESRLFKPGLGGGALLDVGIYPVSLAHYLLGKPARIHAEAAYSPLLTDEQTAILLRFPGGQLATLSCAVRLNTAREAILCGTEGMIRIQPNWWRGTSYTLVAADGSATEYAPETHENGFVYQVLESHDCLLNGRTESEIMPLDETLEIMKTMDAIRDASRMN